MHMIGDSLEDDFERATALRDAGDLVGARTILQQLGDRHPSAFGVWLVLGGVQMAQSDYEAAEKSLAIAITLRPRSELASLAMFHTLKHLHRVNDAFAEMRRFLAIRPESREYELLRLEMDETSPV
jgi:predicted Zn-dependent protease